MTFSSLLFSRRSSSRTRKTDVDVPSTPHAKSNIVDVAHDNGDDDDDDDLLAVPTNTNAVEDPASVVASDYDYDQEHRDGDDSTNVIANLYQGHHSSNNPQGYNTNMAPKQQQQQQQQQTCRWAGISLMLLGVALAMVVVVIWWLVLERNNNNNDISYTNSACNSATADLYRQNDGIYYERVAITCPNRMNSNNSSSNNSSHAEGDSNGDTIIWLDVSAAKISDASVMAQRISEYCRQVCF